MTDIWQRLVARDMPHGQLELLDRAADEMRGCENGNRQPDRRGHAPAGQAGSHRAMRPLGSGATVRGHEETGKTEVG